MSTLEVLRKSKRKVQECVISTGVVYVKSLGSVERTSYTANIGKGVQPPWHEIAALGLCNEDGTLCYDLESEESRQELERDKAEVDGEDWQTIALKIFEVSGMTKKAEENAEKNS